MTTERVEASAALALTYAELDDLADQSAQTLLAVWLLRAELPLDEWVTLVVETLVVLVLEAEDIGRFYGSATEPMDGDPLLPTDDKPRQRAPEDFDQRSTEAPAPDRDIDYSARERNLTERLTKAVETLNERAELTERVERLAANETIAATQRGYQDGIRLQGPETGIVGYRRGINPDCCQLCFWLWKEGYVYDIHQPMHRHTGCRCIPVPTTDRVGRQPLDDDGRALLSDLYGRYMS